MPIARQPAPFRAITDIAIDVSLAIVISDYILFTSVVYTKSFKKSIDIFYKSCKGKSYRPETLD